jgi:hypothetical protein
VNEPVRALAWAPVALLLALAGAHFALVRCCALHPWLGGGFGMFSTVDARHLQAWRQEDGAWAPVELPPDLEDAAERAEALPSRARLRSLARALARSGPGAPVRVEVWETRFDAAMQPVPRRLRAEEVGAGRGRR